MFAALFHGTLIWTIRYYYVTCIVRHMRIQTVKGPLPLPLLFHSLSLCLSTVLSLSLSVSVLSYPLSLSDTFRASLLSSRSEVGRSPRSWACEVRGGKKKNAAQLADVSDVSNTSRKSAANGARRRVFSYLATLSLRGTIWPLTRFSCWQL